ncbi:MAG: DUF2284 domain-containing protein [Lachnospiraceae bacterium]|nr:DUF2284 domain-containing protein [Lachnospiraceae bacterium]
MKYETEVQVKEMSKEDFLGRYYHPGQYLDACKACPFYNKRWSCPPGLPDARGYLECYSRVLLVSVKVNYAPETLAAAVSAGEVERIREETYEQVKMQLLLQLIAQEREVGGGKTLGAGRCHFCDHCAREEGKPCRNPQWRRYSITGFGFDLTSLLEEQFEIKLLWKSQGLPDYDVAVVALFCP